MPKKTAKSPRGRGAGDDEDSPGREVKEGRTQEGSPQSDVPAQVPTAEEEDGKAELDEAAEREKNLRKIAKIWRLVEVVLLGLFVVGAVWATLLFPSLASRTYFSENALLAASSKSWFPVSRGQLAVALKNRLKESLKSGGSGAVVGVIADAVLDLGLDTIVRNTTIDGVRYSTVVAVHHAPRGEGKESVVLTARYPDDAEAVDASAAVLLSLLDVLTTVPWLSKDLIVVLTPASAPGHAILDDWLLHYHAGDGKREGAGGFSPRGGDIWGALALHVPDAPLASLALGIEGMNGQLPNLDLVNVAVYSARRMGLSISVPHRKFAWKSVLPSWIAHDCDTVHSFMSSQAIGRSTGDHGAFKQYKIEALSFVGVPGSDAGGLKDHDVVRYARTVENTLRSISNILERFHQSFFLYLITGADRYIPVEKYLIPCGLMLAPLILKGISMQYFQSVAEFSKKKKSYGWEKKTWPLAEYSVIGSVYLIGCATMWAWHIRGAVLALPLSVLLFVGFVLISGILREGGVVWGYVKGQVLVCVCLGLATAVLTNFSLGVAACLALVPLYMLLASMGAGALQAFVVLLSLFAVLAPAATLTMSHTSLDEALSSSQGMVAGLLFLTILPAHAAFLLSSTASDKKPIQ